MVDVERGETMGKSEMIRLLCCVLISLLCLGCAAKAVNEYPQGLGFVKVSQGTGKGIYSIFTGSASYCMVEFFNQSGIVIDEVIYTDGTCSVVYHTDDKLL